MSKITCIKHGNTIDKSNFYISGNDSIYSGIGHIPICRSCMIKELDEYYERFKDMKKTIYYMLRKMDVGFYNSFFEGALKSGDKPIEVLGQYMRQRNSLGGTNKAMTSFDDGEHPYEAEVVIEDDNSISMPEIRMTKEDYENKEEIIDLLRYDPFEGYSEADQKALYADLLNYLDDEDIVEDQFLVSQIVQVVINNDQIRKLNFSINKFMSTPDLMLENESKIRNLSNMKKQIVDSTDKIAKENEITVKARGGGGSKKSSITMMMQRLRDLDFDEVEVSYYDQMKAYGMQMAADISMKAISEQIQFDENDVSDIIAEQRRMVQSMEGKILDLEEETRQLRVVLHENNIEV